MENRFCGWTSNLCCDILKMCPCCLFLDRRSSEPCNTRAGCNTVWAMTTSLSTIRWLTSFPLSSPSPPHPCRTFFPSITCHLEPDVPRSISCPSWLPFNKISAQEGQVFYFGLSGSHSSGWLITGSCSEHSYSIQIIQDKSTGRVKERQEQQAVLRKGEPSQAAFVHSSVPITGCFCK